MVTLLSKLFIPDRDNTQDPKVRTQWGTLVSILGIVLNLMLGVFKFLAGFFSHSMAIMADGANNLSDGLSSFVAVAGFRLSRQSRDREHPYGHGRYEYISGLIVAVLILVVGVETLRDSVSKILHPEAVEAGTVTIAVLIFSIAVKCYMAFYNIRIGKRIQSETLIVNSRDSLNDCIATGAVLLSTLISLVRPDLCLDGWFGLLVTFFIMKSGIDSLKDTSSLLLGDEPDADLVAKVLAIVSSYEKKGVCGMHDLLVHNYGPGREMISLHVEIPASWSLLQAHGLVDEIERDISKTVGCSTVIHMDPLEQENEESRRLRETALTALHIVGGDSTSLHDFRVVRHEGRKTVFFDAVVPYQLKQSDEEVQAALVRRLERSAPGLDFEIDVDRN